MNFQNYTTKAAEAMQSALQIAVRFQHQALSPLHLLLALIEQPAGVVPSLLQKLQRDPQNIAQNITDALGQLPKVSGGGSPYLTPELKTILDTAESEKQKLQDQFVSTEHLFLALLQDTEMKKIVNLKEEDVLKELKSLRGSQHVTDQDPEGKYQVLEKYTHDFTAMARAGKIDPVIGRDEEIRRIMQILSRRTKNNPVLVGEPGTGKTAIVDVTPKPNIRSIIGRDGARAGIGRSRNGKMLRPIMYVMFIFAARLFPLRIRQFLARIAGSK